MGSTRLFHRLNGVQYVEGCCRGQGMLPFVKCKFNSIKSATQITINSVKAANFAYFCGRHCRSFARSRFSKMKWASVATLSHFAVIGKYRKMQHR